VAPNAADFSPKFFAFPLPIFMSPLLHTDYMCVSVDHAAHYHIPISSDQVLGWLRSEEAFVEGLSVRDAIHNFLGGKPVLAYLCITHAESLSTYALRIIVTWPGFLVLRCEMMSK
jgi:hypothetical protein